MLLRKWSRMSIWSRILQKQFGLTKFKNDNDLWSYKYMNRALFLRAAFDIGRGAPLRGDENACARWRYILDSSNWSTHEAYPALPVPMTPTLHKRLKRSLNPPLNGESGSDWVGDYSMTTARTPPVVMCRSRISDDTIFHWCFRRIVEVLKFPTMQGKQAGVHIPPEYQTWTSG